MNVMLAIATVGLAVPVRIHFRKIRRVLVPFILTLVVSSVVTVSVAVGILCAADANDMLVLSMSTKSITTPIAVALMDELGGSASLAASFIMITGLLGALIGAKLMDLVNANSNAERGITFGITAHAIGTSRALEISSEMAAFSALAMGINGIITALVLPWAVTLFN
jgi:putative effector of murein hydrolase